VMKVYIVIETNGVRDESGYLWELNEVRNKSAHSTEAGAEKALKILKDANKDSCVYHIGEYEVLID